MTLLSLFLMSGCTTAEFDVVQDGYDFPQTVDVGSCGDRCCAAAFSAWGTTPSETQSVLDSLFLEPPSISEDLDEEWFVDHAALVVWTVSCSSAPRNIVVREVVTGTRVDVGIDVQSPESVDDIEVRPYTIIGVAAEHAGKEVQVNTVLVGP